MDVEAVDVRRELVEAVQPRFLGAPVEAVAPVFDQLPLIRQADAVIPVGVAELVGKAGRAQAFLQVGEHGVRHVDRERHDRGVARLLGVDRRGKSADEERSQGHTRRARPLQGKHARL